MNARSPAPDIVDVAVALNFKALVAAVEAAGFVELLKGRGPFTVLVPTDEAFSKLPDGALEHLLKPENETELRGVLTNHVLSGRIMSRDIITRNVCRTELGEDLHIQITDGHVTIGGASVTAADLVAANGVIHVIDTVLLPH